MKYKDLNLKTNKKVNIAKINDQEIEVLQYLPVADKIDLVEIALQKSFENGVYNEVKLDMYFGLYIIEMYTNLEFEDIEKEDEFKLYDELQSNNIIISVIGAMEDEEYDSLVDYLNKMREVNEVYRRSTAALVQSFIQDLPTNAQAAAEIVDNFDPDKYARVVDFAKSVNNGKLD